jgi:biopolymer transport protein ExbD
MSEITTSTISGKKHGFSKSHNHRSTRVDLTPMVDLGFLLITFFVFTTSMSEAKAMELIESREGTAKPVKESASMTIILAENHKIFFYYGSLKNGEDQVSKTNFNEIRTLIVNKKRATDAIYLMYIIKADSASTFEDNINLLDEMAICDIKPGHYAEVDITEEEREIIRSLD